MSWFNQSKHKKSPVIREADVYVAESKDRRKRRKRFLATSAVVLVIGLVSIGAAWTVLYSPVFQVKEIIISGNEVTPADAIANIMDARVLTASIANTILGFRNVLAWSEGSFESNTPELPRVRSIAVERNYVDRTIQIRVDERAPFGIWCTGVAVKTEIDTLQSANNTQSCFWFDTEGVLLDPAPSAVGNLIPVIHDYSGKYLRSQTKVLHTDAVQNLASVFNVLGATNLSVREVRLEDRSLQELKVILRNGPDLYFSLRFPATEAVSVIASLIKNGGGKNPHFSELQSVDFRVEHRAYYK